MTIISLNDKYRTQIVELANLLNCEVRQSECFKNYGMMYVENEPPYIEVPPIKNQIDYLINLHELGHVYHGHTQGRPPYQDKKFYFENGVLKSEAQAWEWTLDHCIGDVTDESRVFMWDTCLGSYYRGYQEAQGQPTRLLNGNR